MSSRKRPAPGSMPTQNQPATSQDAFTAFPEVPDVSQLSDDQFIAWGAGSQVPNYSNSSSTYTTQPVAISGEDSTLRTPLNPSVTSNQLVRRNPNQQMATRDQPYTSSLNDWQDIQGTSTNSLPGDEVESEEDLEQRAAQAKRDALSKRPPKQIPPFIQKLSRFLDEAENTDLIRWSDDGNSFFVLDEDEFAKKLIPMLFKTDKYASFVRQLNMYGFHKRVGLSDNSMRASEQKTKTPSEYYHPYLKRARPELLWLIQKPKPDNKKKGKGQQDDQDSAEDTKDIADGEKVTSNSHEQDPKDDFHSLRREVEALQRSQKQIYNMLSRLRDQNNQYIQQASHLIANHERHESSINAILQFLATFYNKSLEGGIDPAGMFAAAISGNSRPQGNVVEYDESTPTPTPQPSQHSRHGARRPLALLPAPSPGSTGRVSSSPGRTPDGNSRDTGSSSLLQQQGASTQPGKAGSHRQATEILPQARLTSNLTKARAPVRASQSPSIKEDSSTPEESPETSDSKVRVNTNTQDKQKDLMSVIHDASASNKTQPGDGGAPFDFNSALSHYKDTIGNSPLTQEQQDDVLSMLAKSSGRATPFASKHTGDLDDQLANAIASNPYLGHSNQLQANQEQIDMLTRLQQQQSAKVQDLADRLQPLSPNGQIPGISYGLDENNDDFDTSQLGPPHSDFDFDSLVNSNYFPDFDASGPNSNGDLNFDNIQATDATTEDPVRTSTGAQHGDDEEDDGGSLFSDWSGPGKVVGSVGTATGGNSPSGQNKEGASDEGENTLGVRSSKRRRLNA